MSLFKEGAIPPVPFDGLSNIRALPLLLPGKGASRAKLKRVGVLFSGGPAPGGHNVLIGLRRKLPKSVKLIGIQNGFGGLLRGDHTILTEKALKPYEGSGGFDLLGTDRTRITSREQYEAVARVCVSLGLDGLVVIGGDDSNTNAAMLAQYLWGKVQVVGVPKTVDGDLRVDGLLQVPFGFDTATKLYSSLVENLLKDCASIGKYWHFVRLMGRDASHVTLEVALSTGAWGLISEEVARDAHTLAAIVDSIAQRILASSRAGTDYGVILIPEGLFEAIAELRDLSEEIGLVLAKRPRLLNLSLEKRRARVARKLQKPTRSLFAELPVQMQELLCLNRDDHGNLKLSQLPTEAMIEQLVRRRLETTEPGYALKSVLHFYGYEGRCAQPSPFDAKFTLDLGRCAAMLLLDGRSGYLASTNGAKPIGIPLASLLETVDRNGQKRLAIRKALVDLDGDAFARFVKMRGSP